MSAAGFGVVSVSVFFLAKQTRAMVAQTRSVAESLRDNAFESMKSLVIKIDEIFLEYPDLRPYFYSGKDLSETEGETYHKVATLSEAILDIFLSIISRRKHFPHIWAVWPQHELDRYMQELFATSPFMSRYLRERQHWYVPELISLMQQGRLFDQTTPCEKRARRAAARRRWQQR